jgi:hypothetical protein
MILVAGSVGRADFRFGQAKNPAPAINGLGSVMQNCISADGLEMYITASGPGSLGGYDLCVGTRKSVTDPWGPAVNLGAPVNTPYNEMFPSLSADGLTLYFSDAWTWRNPPTEPRPGGMGGPDIWMTTRASRNDPWTTPVSLGAPIDTPLYDVGPTWQPAGGKVGGALQFDGVDDFAAVAFVLSPAQGPFSVFAWVKGGVPGQVILSQQAGVNWLMTAPNGALMTELRDAGRSTKPLISPAIVTDGAWHRVGLVWDGKTRILYVDGTEAAKDTQAGLVGSAGGLTIGAPAALTPGAFWSGLIDDLCIYDEVVKP